ncbi:DUF3373 family protein, partial [Campylobacter jejuni]
LPIEGMGDNLILFNIAYLSDFALPLNNGPIALPGNGTILDDDGVVNLGDLTIANLHFENYKAFGTNFNYFLSLGYSHGNNSQLSPTLSGILQTQGYNGKFNEEDGYAVHVGGRYDFTKALKVGYEF